MEDIFQCKIFSILKLLRRASVSPVSCNASGFRPERVLFPLAVSIFWLSCAAYLCTPPRKSPISLPEKNPRFPNRKPTVSHPEFPDGSMIARERVTCYKNIRFQGAEFPDYPPVNKNCKGKQEIEIISAATLGDIKRPCNRLLRLDNQLF